MAMLPHSKVQNGILYTVVLGQHSQNNYDSIECGLKCKKDSSPVAETGLGKARMGSTCVTDKQKKAHVEDGNHMRHWGATQEDSSHFFF